MTSSNQWIKVVLNLTVVVSVAVTMKLAVPLMLNFAVNDLPAIWFMVISWLKPPYLYLLINGIIITIAASTRFNQNQNNNQSQQQQQPINPHNTDLTSESPHERVCDIKPIVMVEPPPVDYETIKRCDLDVLIDVSTTSTGAIKSPSKFNYPIKEKQILTSRFPHNKKPTSKGARALRVLKPKKHETMDSTWKMITDGRHKPLNKQFRESDTFVDIQHSSNEFKKVVRKSETFKDRTNYENENQYLQPMVVSGGKLNKDNSLSRDELNNRVEAFIKKFNDDMSLQRQQSLNQYWDMLKPGLH